MSGLNSLIEWLRAVTPVEIKTYYWAAARFYGSPWFYLGIAVILLLEWIRPAIREQRVFSWALLQDFLWFNLDLAFKAAALPAFIGLLRLLYARVTGGFVIPGLSDWPLVAKFVLAFMVFDFLQWFHHWVRHRITPLWHFHVIHHSQRDLNLFTDLRVHFVEYLVAQVLTFIPMFLLGLSPYAIVGVAFVTQWYTRLIHANVRTNFGPFRHVLVSPQFHRIHHSIERRHQDKNFGVIFTVWDRAFGTLYANYEEYPQTGVEGVLFPPPSRLSPRAWARDFGGQILYPFRQLLVRAPAPGSGSTPPRPDAGPRDAPARAGGRGRPSPRGAPEKLP